MSDWRELAPSAASIAVAAAVLPWTPDPFEEPKRAVWAITALVLSWISVFGEGKLKSAGTKRPPFQGSAPDRFRTVLFCAAVLLAWMTCRSFSTGPFWRATPVFVAWTTPLVLFILGSTCAARRGWTGRAAFRVAVAVGLSEAVLAILQRFGIDPVFGATTGAFSYAPGRMVGTVGYQNQAAELFGVALFCVPSTVRNRWLRVAVCGILATATFLSCNRGAILAMCAVGSCVACRSIFGCHCGTSVPIRRKNAVSWFAVVPICAIAMVVIPELRERMGELRDIGNSVAVGSRAWMARTALSIWRDNPLAGGGAGIFAYEYCDRLGAILPERKEHANLGSIVWARETHCDPLQFGAEFGIVGLVLLGAFAGSLVYGFGRSLTCRHSAFACSMHAAVFLSASSFFSFSWQTSFAAPLAGMLLGIAVGSAAEQKRSGPENGNEKRRNASMPASGQSFVSAIACGTAAIISFSALSASCANILFSEASRLAAECRSPWFLHGGFLARAAATALDRGSVQTAFELSESASKEWNSPDLMIVRAISLDGTGRNKEALVVWRRLVASGLRHDEALRGLSLCLERLGRMTEAADAEEERFRLWSGSFTDADLFRLCSIDLMSGRSENAEWISRRFHHKLERLGETDARWTAEWANLRGGALLAMGRKKAAKVFFEDALRKKPGLVSAERNLESILD